MFNPGPCVYMKKVVVGHARARDRHQRVGDRQPQRGSKRLKISVQELGVVILDRPRHDDLVAEVRELGSRVLLISDGDVAGAIATAWPNSGVDVLLASAARPRA